MSKPILLYNKPIALITERFTNALNWCHHHLDIREYNSENRRLIDIMGQEYIMVSDMKHAIGFEFSGMIVIPDCIVDLSVINFVSTRIRK